MTAAPNAQAFSSRRHAWAWTVLLALAPLWLVGVFDRGLWTPDEPREADIVWHMSLQSDRTLPLLADAPFLEKPPLSYWISGAAIAVFGDSPAAARLPNLLYAVLTALALGALAASAAGPTAAVVAALIGGSALLAFRATVWLAPDACLLAACAIALLGAYRGYMARPGWAKLAGYTLMHAGAAAGFMAKSAPGWLAPALALATLIAWERRWSELKRWELYAPLALQALLIGPWILAVAGSPHGAEALQMFFWRNVVGRFTKIQVAAGPDYTQGHGNWPGKYLLELPVYLLPWTLVVIAALAAAWKRVRDQDAASTAWRFALAASLPFLLVLSLAATARDIYAAPALLGLSLLVALWAGERGASGSRMDALVLAATRRVVGLVAAALTCTLLALGLTAPRGSAFEFIVAAVATIGAAAVSLRSAARLAERGSLSGSLACTYAAYAAAVSLSALALFPAVDRWQDLGTLAEEITLGAATRPLAVLNADETTVAMLDHPLRTHYTALSGDRRAAPQAVSDWFQGHGNGAVVLVLLPGHAPGQLTPLLDRGQLGEPPGDGVAAELQEAGVARIVARFQLPHGRRYALLGPVLAR